MLDRDLATLYQVETRTLKQAVKKNIDRFPNDFLTDSASTRCLNQSFGGAKPFVFTEQGVSSLSTVLTSKIAIEIYINIMRAFVNMRKHINSNSLLYAKIETLEKQQISY